MNRRTFAGASAAIICAATDSPAEDKPAGRDVYELRTYTLKAEERPILDDYLKAAYIPAVKRHGAGPVGVFAGPVEAESLRVVVLVVHSTADSAAMLPTKLAADAEYRKSAAAYLDATAESPVYARIESSLLVAIPGMPHLGKTDPAKPRLFNLRVYESHNERSAAKKIEMFEKGELAIFQRVGLTPVFFASAVVGAAMPNLTYLLVFPDEEGRKKAWGAFRADPAWLKLKAEPGYADKEIVSKITNHILTPAAYSEI